MRTGRHTGLLLIAIVVGLGSGLGVRAEGQDSPRPDLNGRWTLNGELSEDAHAKIQQVHAGQGAGHGGARGAGHGPGRHAGGASGGDQAATMNELRDILLRTPASFTLTQHADRIVLTDNDGAVRTLAISGKREKVHGRDVRTRWDSDRIVSDTTLGGATITETYERAPDAPRLHVITTMEMAGHVISIRRVYDAMTGSK